jgi:hypothetical protein
MDRDEKLAPADMLEREVAGAAETDGSNDDRNDLRALADDLRRRLEAGRQSTTLADLRDELSSIDDHLAHVQDNTLGRERVDYLLTAIERNTKATSDTARAINGNVLVIALVTVFWSVFVFWKNYDNMQAFFHAVANRIYHPFS